MTITINESGTITGASTLATTVASPTLTTPNIDSAQIPTVSGTAPLYMCRAWVNFNGTGTVAIRASGNVQSITDRGTGTYTVNFSIAMPDADYAGLITSGFASGVREDVLGFGYTDSPYAPTTGSYTVKFVRADTNASVDTNYAMVAILR